LVVAVGGEAPQWRVVDGRSCLRADLYKLAALRVALTRNTPSGRAATRTTPSEDGVIARGAPWVSADPWWAALTGWGIMNTVNVVQAAAFLSRHYYRSGQSRHSSHPERRPNRDVGRLTTHG
jgi:hypothetical protein